MKKIILFIAIISVTAILLADLEINVPFEMDIVGESFTDVGDYEYTSEWMEITNTGSESQEYTIMVTYANTPEGWGMSICNTETCYMPNFAIPFTLAPEEVLQVHIVLTVSSTDGFAFPITFGGGDLSEPMVLDFTFNTADNLNSADENLILSSNISNYPNPFNPETTINFSTPSHIKNGRIEIFNAKGQQIETLKTKTNSITWKADNNSSGIYFYRLKSDNYYSEMKKMTLLK